MRNFRDFNADLLKIDSHEDSNYFYNVLTSQSFRPLILQPTRVTATAPATLIDNIFINDMAVSSTGGNITTTISDHFSQFSALNLKPKNIASQDRRGRSYRNFNHDEFDKELLNINWELLFHNKNCDEKILIFLDKINRLLDEMAPIRKLTKKEMDLKQNPWLTTGIFKSIKARDDIHKKVFECQGSCEKKKSFQRV